MLFKYRHIELLTLFLVIIGLLPGIAQAQERRVLSPNEVPEAGEMAEGWQRNWWGDSTTYQTKASPRSDYAALVLQADSFTVSRYHRQVSLEPNSTYRLSYWVKTENVSGRENGGAGVRLGGFQFKPNAVLTGSQDWTKQEIEFDVEDDDSMVLEFLLGKQGPAQGKFWIDEIFLEQVSHTPFEPSITLDLAEQGTEMSEYIYGQFIEHMGNSIYGGIWAEMLEDRKFYYAPGSSQSPWQFSGPDSTQFAVDSVDAYVGENSPLLHSENDSSPEIFQEGLALQESAAYEGHIVLAGDKQVQVDVTLTWGPGDENSETVQIDDLDYEYRSYELQFTAGADSDSARISINPRGEGSVYVGTLSLMPATNINGFRPDVIALLEELDSPVYRWPGGNFVSGYNWKDGVGERDKREPRVDRAWESDYQDAPWNAVESNDVGIHEFMKLCEILNTEAYIAVNTGLGMAKLAAEEVEYLNGSSETRMGKWRAKNGHPEPYDVTFWAVGNEMYGDWQLGHMPLDKYVKKHKRVAKAMWDVDPNIELVAVGAPGEWNEKMYKENTEYMTLISEHFYRQDWHGGGLMTHVKQIPNAIKEKADEHRMWREKLDILEGRDIQIALDEWNFWYGPHVYGLLGTRYYLRDALGIAAGFNEYLRNSDIIYMANYAQTVNVIGAIKATKNDAFLAATGVVLKAYREHFGYIPVPLSGEVLPFDIAAALTTDGEYLTISVVNPTREAQTLPMNITGGSVNESGTAYVITGKNDMVYNEVSNKDAVAATAQSVQIENGEVNIPAISAVIFKFKVED